MTESNTNTKGKLTYGNIPRQIIKLTSQMLIGMGAMMAFNLIDTYFVSRLGTAELAAITFTFPLVMIIGGISIGIGTGASAVISKAIGRNDQHKVQRYTTDALTLSVTIVLFVVIAGLLTIDETFRLLGAEEAVLPLIKEYMQIWYPGVIFVIIPMTGNNAIRATGDTKTPSMIMVVAVVVNSVLDPVLIFGFGPIPALGMQGAALATVAARAVTLVVSLLVLHKREKMLTFSIPSFKEGLESWKRILYIGIPTTGANLVMPVAVTILTALIAQYGSAPVAAFGVVSRIEMFGLTVVTSLSAVLGPFIGQNWGTGKLERLKEGTWFSLKFVAVWGAFLTVSLAFLGKSLGSLFNPDPEILDLIQVYFWIVPISYAFRSVVRLTQVSLNVLNKPFTAAFIVVIHMFVLTVPLSFTGSYLFGFYGIIYGYSLANITAGCIALMRLKNHIKMIVSAGDVVV